MAQQIINVPLNEDTDNLIENVTAAWNLLPDMTIELACRGKQGPTVCS
jgi:hypothetical protein